MRPRHATICFTRVKCNICAWQWQVTSINTRVLMQVAALALAAYQNRLASASMYMQYKNQVKVVCLRAHLAALPRLIPIPPSHQQRARSFAEDYVKKVQACHIAETQRGQLILTCTSPDSLDASCAALDQVTAILRRSWLV